MPFPEATSPIFSGYTCAFVRQLTCLYDRLEDIDCETYSSLCSTLLTLHLIPHTVRGGLCIYREAGVTRVVQPHFWLSLTAEDDTEWLIDYRLRANLPAGRGVPHGVFQPNSDRVLYQGEDLENSMLSPERVKLAACGLVMGAPPLERSDIRALKQQCAERWQAYGLKPSR